MGEPRSYINIYSNPVGESPTRSISLSLIVKSQMPIRIEPKGPANHLVIGSIRLVPIYL